MTDQRGRLLRVALGFASLAIQACMGPAASSGVKDPQIPIEVVRPEGAGPFPAVGYLVAIPDSFSPRGYPQGVCGYGGLVPARLRADDAYAALRHVENLPIVLADKIGLLGHSHGGWTVLAAMDREVAAEARVSRLESRYGSLSQL